MTPLLPWSTLYNPEDITLLEGWTNHCLERDLELDKGYFDHTGLDEASLRKIQAAYYGCISEIDSYIGRFLDILEEKGIYDNTVIILTSDHGDYMGYHHLLLKSNHMYDPLMRIPLCIKSVGQKTDRVNSCLNSNTAMASQILAECGIQNEHFSESLELGSDYVFAHSHEAELTMVRSRSHKLIWNNLTEKCLFFDLVNDPSEIHDISGDKDYR